MVDAIARSTTPSLSYLAEDWPEPEVWRTEARAKVFELLAFNPPKVRLNATVDSRRKEGSLTIEEVSYDMPYGPRTQGFFLYPRRRHGKLPAIVALHDHGGFKYYGKEKIVDFPNEPEIIHEFKAECYGGRSWATEIAKRGFAVLAVDLFLWGSRRIPVETLNEEFERRFDGLELGSRDHIQKYHEFAAEHEHIIAKTIFAAGATWPGIFTYEDRRSVDYLLTRPEVDPDRIGCGGLSGGGLRTIFLAGLDPRMRCAVCVGFMSTFRELLRNNIKCHTWMLYVPHLPRFLDLPDVISLRAPSPLMVQYNEDDPLYTLKGQQDADLKIGEVYSKIGCRDNYSGRSYAGTHKFDVEMQEDAFDWFEKWLV